jgi:hypothetical protein
MFALLLSEATQVHASAQLPRSSWGGRRHERCHLLLKTTAPSSSPPLNAVWSPTMVQQVVFIAVTRSI